nr:HAD family hydrolase [Pseudooceanicola aestuarii]
MTIKGVLFDKDGTLFEFGATWNAWCLEILAELSAGNEGLRRDLANAVLFDLGAGRFRPDSPVIAGTNRQAAECLLTCLPGMSLIALEEFLARRAAAAVPVPPVPLAPLLDDLRGRGLGLGVITNDSEVGAFGQLEAAGLYGLFDFVAGFDSGHGAKPDAAPLLAFCDKLDLLPASVVMVGDSLHDLHAAERAGMIRVGVLTGPATQAELAPHADAILPHIGYLPEWLGRQAPAS